VLIRVALTVTLRLATAGVKRCQPEIAAGAERFVAFGLVRLTDSDLLRKPLVERKRILRLVVPPGSRSLLYADQVYGKGIKPYLASATPTWRASWPNARTDFTRRRRQRGSRSGTAAIARWMAAATVRAPLDYGRLVYPAPPNAVQRQAVSQPNRTAASSPSSRRTTTGWQQ
jgi:hypothetical protein